MTLRASVSRVMTADVATVREADALSDARALMFERRIHHVPVVDDGGVLVGILSTNDLLRAGPHDHFARPRDVEDALATRTVGEIMTADVVSVRPTDTIERAASLLELGTFHALPVATEEGKVLGIVTTGDLLRYLARQAWEPDSPHARPSGVMIGNDGSS
jgi:CBS-domain-containing membrane protein